MRKGKILIPEVMLSPAYLKYTSPENFQLLFPTDFQTEELSVPSDSDIPFSYNAGLHSPRLDLQLSSPNVKSPFCYFSSKRSPALYHLNESKENAGCFVVVVCFHFLSTQHKLKLSEQRNLH